MANDLGDQDILFYQLVISLHAAAMQQMGRASNPVSGKVERDLTLASNSIDLLEMLERKMKNNLSDEETKTLGRALYELRLLYVEEDKKDKAASGSDTKQDAEVRKNESARSSEKSSD